ncbi:MAG: diguanylate cyclase [Actinobacteria bacterium]|nr:diguanylate cyclase [Actinomycetota bacterium]MCA1721919.1 diguanylate cyclase [Actinomycetota bacterium]
MSSPDPYPREADVPSPLRASAARATMTALAASPDVFETFFEQARIGLALADLSTRFVRVNATYAELVGSAPEDLVGVAFQTQLHPDDRPGSDERARLLLTGREQALQSEQRYVTPDGRVTWVLHGVTVVPDRTGAPAWFAVSAQDITERRRAEQDLRDLTAVLSERAVRDPLTGLANRSLLEERLRAVLARDARTGTATALLFLDLDEFKAINDEHGHAVGDSVLRHVAGRLKAGVRPSDTVARLGGDEFVVLVEGAGEEGVRALVERLQVALRAPMPCGDLDLEVGVSIGTAFSVAGAEDPGALLARADRRMYDAKRARRTSS